MPTAVITGAGSGIGRAVTQGFIARGWSVALMGRRQDALASTLEDAPGWGTAGATSVAIAVDVRDRPAVDDAFEEVVARLGRIDVLVNNAGLFGTGAPFEDYSLESWTTVIDTNLTGAFHCAQAAYRIMLRQDPRGGRIINNGSLSAHVPRPYAVAYTASKHAISGLTKTIALEGRQHGITCGQIDIGNASTDMTAAMASGVPQADGQIRAEPRMDVRHVVDAVLYMAELPLDANVPNLTVMASGMPYVGRG